MFIHSLLRAAAAVGLSLHAGVSAQDPASWSRPTPAFRVLGPIHYVGTEGLAAYLIRTPAGPILIDGTLERNAPAIERGIVGSGVRVRDVKLLLLSHAHFDHAAGLARLKRDTGARLVVGAGDARAVATGTPPGETSYGVIRFPAVAVDQTIGDGERVALGGVTLTAVATPGHTPGCTSWRMRVVERGRALDVLFLCSLTVAGNKLVGNRAYPGIVGDFRRTFARLRRERADVVLPFHPEQAQVFERRREGRLVDPALLPRLAGEAEAAFGKELKKQGG